MRREHVEHTFGRAPAATPFGAARRPLALTAARFLELWHCCGPPHTAVVGAAAGLGVAGWPLKRLLHGVQIHFPTILRPLRPMFSATASDTVRPRPRTGGTFTLLQLQHDYRKRARRSGIGRVRDCASRVRGAAVGGPRGR